MKFVKGPKTLEGYPRWFATIDNGHDLVVTVRKQKLQAAIKARSASVNDKPKYEKEFPLSAPIRTARLVDLNGVSQRSRNLAVLEKVKEWAEDPENRGFKPANNLAKQGFTNFTESKDYLSKQMPADPDKFNASSLRPRVINPTITAQFKNIVSKLEEAQRILRNKGRDAGFKGDEARHLWDLLTLGKPEFVCETVESDESDKPTRIRLTAIEFAL